MVSKRIIFNYDAVANKSGVEKEFSDLPLLESWFQITSFEASRIFGFELRAMKSPLQRCAQYV